MLRQPRTCGGGDWDAGLGGCGDPQMEVAGLQLGPSGEMRPLNPHLPPPALPGSSVAFGPGGREYSALLSQRCLGWEKAREDRRNAEAAEAGSPLGFQAGGGDGQNREGG